ncbi:CDP-alcohol phosphatidyltransferase family protein [Myxococcota bacterium]|nr:CDP-alcohol phosphatidyltransferase family protein [Myxococcota bacterium]
MIDDPFRAVVPRYAGPFVALYGRLGLSPNHVTFIGFALAILASFAVAEGWRWVALLLWWVSRIADGTDGHYARQTGRATPFGAYLDIVLDMAAYGAMVVGFAVAEPALSMQWAAMLFLYVLCIASALALGAQEERLALPPRDDRGLRLGAGLAEGGETGIAYSVFLLFPDGLPVTTAIWIGMLVLTVLLRTLLAHRLLR